MDRTLRAISGSIFIVALGFASFAGCSSKSTDTPVNTADGGGTSEAGSGSGSGSCSTLGDECAQCANANAKDTCSMYASGGDQGHCKTIVDAKTFAAGSTACMP
ncbi:MAG: hypothetical protein ABIP39_16550 [Polyangiaceae bacterium]